MTSDENPYFVAGAASSSAAGDDAGGSRANSLAASTPRPDTLSQTPAATPFSEHPPWIPSRQQPSLARSVFFRPLGDRQQSSIRLRRLSNTPAPPLDSIPGESAPEQQPQTQQPGDNGFLRPLSRLRSGSRSRAGSTAVPLGQLPTIQDGVAQDFATGSHPAQVAIRTNDGNVAPGVVVEDQHGSRGVVPLDHRPKNEYDSDIVDILDVIDPEVATLSSITNVQNSLFVPSLGRFINRRPTYELSITDRIPGAYPPDVPEAEGAAAPEPAAAQRGDMPRAYSITSEITPSHYAVLPSGASLEGWSREEVDQLNDYVRHMLHSRRSRLKRRLRAFGKYVRKPLGFAVTLYATLITLFGLAWVLFLIGWIYVGNKQLYVINVIDNILVALFAIVGDGMAPFRLIDTYHMAWIVHYHRKTWKLRKAHALPKLENKNDLPTQELVPGEDSEAQPDLEAARRKETSEQQELSVLSPKQQARLTYHQNKMFKSHTFYKPHETETHYAFPLSLLIVIVLLLDLHSCLQISLGSVTWSIPYQHRSTALTTAILCCSITANTSAGIFIAIGDRRTRKKDVIERILRQELTDRAMRKVQKEREEREAEERAARKDAKEVGRFDAQSPLLHRLSEEMSSGLEKKDEVEDGVPTVPGHFPA